ncbi:MAG TPA: glutaminyl-peptide cyclotransferase [Anaerolineae bacterium]|nr:glutaminyl-peptide cyclotransferase [Anaerolineae bacterium]
MSLFLVGCRQAPAATPVATIPQPRATPTPRPQLFPTCPFDNSTTPVYSYDIINVYPHDAKAFTQGLVYDPDTNLLYEGTGLYGRSTVRQVDLESGDISLSIGLGKEFFGEGITLYGDKIIQLTWQEQVGFVYDKTSLRPERQFSYTTEGWGLTHDGQNLIMSDGSSTLTYLDPNSFELIKRIAVTENGQPVTQLNELEYIYDTIYANIWQTNHIVQISPQTGQVQRRLDLTGLLATQGEFAEANVLNGIAFDATTERLWVTGKLWPYLFEIKITC